MAYTNIDDPSAHFQIATYTGAGANQTVTNDGNSDLQPDWLWIKRRNAGYAHALFDSNRGLGSSNPPMLECNSESAENSNQNWISGVGTDSFTIGINEQNLSNTAGTYVAWQWKANGGTTASNSNGNITSTVQANTTAGFSVVTWTGDGSTSGKNVGHGLGAVPKMIISKDRDGTSNLPGWYIYHQAIGAEDHLQFTAGAKADSPTWGDTTPTSSVFSVGGEGAYIATNQNNIDYVAYVFADVQGYSKFGSYIGNGESLNGPFVYTGFKPAWVMIKNTQTSGRNWYIYDIKRRTFNANGTIISANTTSAEATDQAIDILSNGFKVRPGALGSFGTSNINHSGQKMIYMAFAENPFVTSTGVPTTAR